MKYMGSKSRIAKHIVPIIQGYIDKNKIENYYEPFCGGLNVIDKIICKNKFASDINKYLIALWKHLQDGGEFLPEVTKDFYSSVRSNKDLYDDWIVGNVGFLASYNGRWFDGGYAKTGIEKTKYGERIRNYYEEAKQNIIKQAELIKDIDISVKDYMLIEDISGFCIYLDPPYQNKKEYDTSKNFDYDLFWNKTRMLSENNIVIISEENAPEDFDCIWQQKITRSIKAKDKSKSIEKLFILKDKKGSKK